MHTTKRFYCYPRYPYLTHSHPSCPGPADAFSRNNARSRNCIGHRLIAALKRSQLGTKGFTIIDALSTMITTGILGGLAVAGYQSQLKTQRANNAVNDFMAFLQSGRSAAIAQPTR